MPERDAAHKVALRRLNLGTAHLKFEALVTDGHPHSLHRPATSEAVSFHVHRAGQGLGQTDSDEVDDHRLIPDEPLEQHGEGRELKALRLRYEVVGHYASFTRRRIEHNQRAQSSKNSMRPSKYVAWSSYIAM